MCYFLYLASPLTLSEVRSMLPAGLTADLASSADHQRLRAIHPEAVTVARILSGRCSCDLVRPRLSEPREDERHLRQRYRNMNAPRATVIAALDRHRRGDATRCGQVNWPAQLSRFVAEHARNAGPTLYYLDFCPDPASSCRPVRVSPMTATASTVISGEGWLAEAIPTLVTR
jgi:hypothetical protein